MFTLYIAFLRHLVAIVLDDIMEKKRDHPSYNI